MNGARLYWRLRSRREHSKSCGQSLSACGSWLACAAGTAVGRDNYVDIIAGKPAPTRPHASRRLYEHHKICWSWLACAADTAAGRDNYVDIIAGKPAPTRPHASRRLYEHHKTCGSWLACDTGTAVGRDNYVDIIAGKPAPTRICKQLALPPTPQCCEHIH